MKPLMKRRTVYAATIVTMLVMVSGFALASGLFMNFSSTTVYGNQGTISTANTIYSSGITASMFGTGAGGSGGTCTLPSSSSGTEVTVTAWVSGGPGACTTTPDYVMQLTFTSAATLTSSKTYTDYFVISSEFGGASTYTTSSVSIVCALGAGGNQCQAVINIDTGIAATMAQPSLDAIGVTVTGS
jgi:hypothetical protein